MILFAYHKKTQPLIGQLPPDGLGTFQIKLGCPSISLGTVSLSNRRMNRR
jgi:hypothetical protein